MMTGCVQGCDWDFWCLVSFKISLSGKVVTGFSWLAFRAEHGKHYILTAAIPTTTHPLRPRVLPEDGLVVYFSNMLQASVGHTFLSKDFQQTEANWTLRQSRWLWPFPDERGKAFFQPYTPTHTYTHTQYCPCIHSQWELTHLRLTFKRLSVIRTSLGDLYSDWPSNYLSA